MLLRDCSWADVEQRLQRDKRIVLVLGATEEHSDLSLETDTLVPLEIARKACAEEDVLLAPPLPFGISTWSLAYPGTISLRTATMCAVVKDMVDSLARVGFRRFIVLNGHGFNRAVAPAFGEAIADYPGADVVFLQWWELEGVREVARDAGLGYGHANWSEAFPFTILRGGRRLPPAVHPPPNLLLPPDEIRASFGAGHAPGPLEAPEVAEQMFERAVIALKKILQSSR
jgi:creatinine amidohydrolase